MCTLNQSQTRITSHNIFFCYVSSNKKKYCKLVTIHTRAYICIRLLHSMMITGAQLRLFCEPLLLVIVSNVRLPRNWKTLNCTKSTRVDSLIIIIGAAVEDFLKIKIIMLKCGKEEMSERQRGRAKEKLLLLHLFEVKLCNTRNYMYFVCKIKHKSEEN